MKITHYQTRDKKGRFTRKAKKLFKAVVIITGVYFAGTIGYDLYKSFQPEPIAQIEAQDESILTQEEQAKLKQQAQLMEREAILKKRKSTLEADYKSKSEAIELELASIRSERVSFK